MDTYINPTVLDDETVPTPFSDQPRRFDSNVSVPIWLKVVGLLLVLTILPLALTTTEGWRGSIALGFVGILYFLLRREPARGVCATIVYLAVLGGLRRWLISVFDWSPTDPLLVAVPVAAFFYIMTTRRTWKPTTISRLISLLLVIMFVQMFNPEQGNLAIGFAGALFYIAPLLWYFIGRQIGTPVTISRVSRTVIILSVLGCLYGLYQTFFRVFPKRKTMVGRDAEKLRSTER